ncbi:YggS family pyridoxal phosphate-dependent enzyme [Pelagibacteraceae bacterium]|nr:YggS family pyridoxal phosphate-dependent enzyme [Pelagibacteraceae bacterium]
MHNSEQNLNLIKNEVKEIVKEKQLKTTPQIIVVTKKFSLDKIIPLIKMGHIHFGENQIQEAEGKWAGVKNQYKNIKLHMLGKLQSNKAKKAVQIFDYIHSLDNLKLAKKISACEKETNKKIKVFIQVNLGQEDQKSGILPEQLFQFYDSCNKDFSLNIIGLMCLPPINSDPSKYFEILKNNSKKLNLLDLSMGMSSDYRQAVINGSTFLRLGTAILGKRNN